jgi:hypothetical protein
MDMSQHPATDTATHAKTVSNTPAAIILVLAALILAGLGFAVFTWGAMGLTLPMVAAVLLTMGK